MVYKPNSVSASWRMVIIHLVPTLQSGSCDLPVPPVPAPTSRGGQTMRATSKSGLLDLAPDGVCRAPDVAIGTGGLLHHRFTFTPPSAGQTAFCCTFRIPNHSGPLPLGGILPCGVRTFLPPPSPTGAPDGESGRQSPDQL